MVQPRDSTASTTTLHADLCSHLITVYGCSQIRIENDPGGITSIILGKIRINVYPLGDTK